MTINELRREKADYYKGKYQLIRWDNFKYRKLKNILFVRRSGHADNDTYNDTIIISIIVCVS